MDQPIPTISPVAPSPKTNWLLFLLTGVVILLVGITAGLVIGKYIYAPKPTPTADPTANWKTYTSNKYDYQFKYPQIPPEASSAFKFSLNDKLSELWGPDNLIFRIEVFENINNPQLWWENQAIEPFTKLAVNNFDFTETTLNSYPGYSAQVKTEFQEPKKVFRTYVLSNNDNVYLIHSDYGQWSNQILSTFKFVEQATPKPTCKPRPACLDTSPRCLLPETSDMCPPNQKL